MGVLREASHRGVAYLPSLASAVGTPPHTIYVLAGLPRMRTLSLRPAHTRRCSSSILLLDSVRRQHFIDLPTFRGCSLYGFEAVIPE